MAIYTVIEYQYRDACNYKKFNAVILKGKITYNEVEPFLHEGEFFIPSVVGLEDLQDEPFTVDDHIWHEIEEISETNLASNTEMTAENLLQRFKDAKQNDWYEYEVYERKGLL